eukprot:1000813-Pyramimonas_sp.AAC.1
MRPQPPREPHNCPKIPGLPGAPRHSVRATNEQPRDSLRRAPGRLKDLRRPQEAPKRHSDKRTAPGLPGSYGNFLSSPYEVFSKPPEAPNRASGQHQEGPPRQSVKASSGQHGNPCNARKAAQRHSDHTGSNVMRSLAFLFWARMETC